MPAETRKQTEEYVKNGRVQALRPNDDFGFNGFLCCKRPSFASQKTAFRVAFYGLLQRHAAHIACHGAMCAVLVWRRRAAQKHSFSIPTMLRALPIV